MVLILQICDMIWYNNIKKSASYQLILFVWHLRMCSMFIFMNIRPEIHKHTYQKVNAAYEHSSGISTLDTTCDIDIKQGLDGNPVGRGPAAPTFEMMRDELGFPTRWSWSWNFHSKWLGDIPKFALNQLYILRYSNSSQESTDGVRRVMHNVRFITKITGYTTGTTLRSLRFHSSKGRISADYGCQVREFTELILLATGRSSCFQVSSVLRMARANPMFIHNL